MESGEDKRGPLHAPVITHSRRNLDHCGQKVVDYVREKEWKAPVAAAQQRTDDEELKREPDHQTAELNREAHPTPILRRATPRIAGFLCCDYAVTERFPSHGSGVRIGPLAIVTLPSHGSGVRIGPLAIVTLPSHGSGVRIGPLAIVTLPSHGSGVRIGPLAIVTLPSHGSGVRMGPLATFTGSASSM